MTFFISGEIDSEISDAFREIRKEIHPILNKYFSSRNYGSDIEEIGLIPIILGPRFTGHKERRLVQHKEKSADYRLFINYDKFKNGSKQQRKILFLKNLIEAITDIDRKLKGKFEGEKLIKDIYKIFPFLNEE